MKLLLRFLAMGALVLALLVPLSLIRGTIHERQAYRDQAIERVAQGSAGEQRLMAPLRVVPWSDVTQVQYTDKEGVTRTHTERSSGTLLHLPKTLDLRGDIVPETRRIGVFEVRVYRLRAHLAASFDTRLPAVPAGTTRTYGRPYLVLGVSDVRGLVGVPKVLADGRALRFEPGTRDYSARISGVSATLPGVDGQVAPAAAVRMEFVLAGTEALSIVPLADRNQIAIDSAWPHPSFGGDFLPTNRTIHAGGKGFEASWDISSLASQARLQVAEMALSTGTDNGVEQLQIRLVDPVEVYAQADRASKYGILFVLLTFVGFALFELIRRLSIHPLQYLLVGLALAIFFLLLLSLAEHMAFWKAYLAAAAACIGLQFTYLSGVLGSAKRAAGFAVMLTALYAALYSLLVSEDNALLMGSLLLFGILAAIMWITRKLDWYALGATLR